MRRKTIPKWQLRRDRRHVTISAVGNGGAGEKGKWTRGSPSSQRPILRLHWFPLTVGTTCSRMGCCCIRHPDAASAIQTPENAGVPPHDGNGSRRLAAAHVLPAAPEHPGVAGVEAPLTGPEGGPGGQGRRIVQGPEGLPALVVPLH